MYRSVHDVQRDFALSSGLRSQIIWDSYAPDEAEILHEKIRQLILNENARNQRETAKRHKTIFDNIWAQRKYTNGALLSSIIYVMVTGEKDPDLARFSTEFSCHPVFRTRKCLNADDSRGCCMIFIDEMGRVYRNWQHFLDTNLLPKGSMVAPLKGVYDFDENDQVLLEISLTPAARKKSVVLNTTDTVAGVGGLIATVPIAAALVVPVAAPLMVAATIGGLATAAYTTVRSGMQLTDRHKHSETLALTDASARREWLGVASGVVGLGATGATRVLKYAATAKDISLGAKIAVNSINVSSLVLSGSGVVNCVYDIYTKYNNDELISNNDLLYLASSLIVFTHSVNNLRITIKAGSRRGRSVRTVRTQLSRQMRSLFERISRETATLRGRANPGRAQNPFDMIRTVNDIPFNDILQNLQLLNTNLPAAGSSSSVDALLTAGQIGGVGAALREPLNLLIRFASGDTNIDIVQLTYQLGSKFVEHILNPSSLREIMSSICRFMGDKVLYFLLNLTRTFLDVYVDRIDRTLITFVSTESVLYKMLMHCVRNYTNFGYKFLESKTVEILTALEQYFESLKPYVDGVKRVICKSCNGYYIEYNLP